MFDRLIESDTAGAEFKSRRRYFLVSSIVVGALFVSAVIFSIYASEVGLGADSYELTALLTPVQPAADEPEPPQPQDRQRRTASQQPNDAPTRIISQQRPDETPLGTPPISTTKNTYLSRPFGNYKISNIDGDPVGADGLAPPNVGYSNSSDSSVVDKRINDKPVGTVENDPPPAIKRSAPKHVGIVNGLAISLPKPPYPAAATALHIEGKVDIQVTIDESGSVISARAASGNPLLRTAAENAAWKARFSPTILDGTPVKVTGVIVYNFIRN